MGYALWEQAGAGAIRDGSCSPGALLGVATPDVEQGPVLLQEVLRSCEEVRVHVHVALRVLHDGTSEARGDRVRLHLVKAVRLRRHRAPCVDVLVEQGEQVALQAFAAAKLNREAAAPSARAFFSLVPPRTSEHPRFRGTLNLWLGSSGPVRNWPIVAS